MKKLLSILIITLFCITTFASPIAAEDSQVLFVSTESNDSFDDYVEENIHYFTQLYPYASDPVVGTGIKVYGSLNEQYI